MDDDGFGIFMKFVLLLAAIFAAVIFAFYSIPLFALWVLIKGWDNTGVFVKIIAGIIPLFGLFTLVTQNLGEGLGSIETAWLVAAPVVNYGMLYIAYARRDQMFNV